MQVGLAEGKTETQSSLWTMAVATVGETPSLTQEFIEKCARDQQLSCIFPSLGPPLQAAPQHSNQACPSWVNT